MTRSAARLRDPVDAARALDTTAQEINRWDMLQRRQFLQSISTGPAAHLGAGDRWRNLEGCLVFFNDQGLGAPDTWISQVNAAVLESVQLGIALTLGRPGVRLGETAAALAWERYLDQLTNAELTERRRHDAAWSNAKEIATNTAAKRAHLIRAPRPSSVERQFLYLSRAYNWCMRHRRLTDKAITAACFADPQPTVLRPELLDWLTDVTDPEAARVACQAAWELACAGPHRDLVGSIRVCTLFLTKLRHLAKIYHATSPQAPSPKRVHPGHQRPGQRPERADHR